jgi:tetratricopeptide (TPR) repeat protein
MLETIRDFARERLAAGAEETAIRDSHAFYLLRLAEAAEPELVGPAQTEWLARLAADHDNARAALDWLDERGDSEAALRLAGALWRFWWIRGHLYEGRARLEHLLERAPQVPAAVRARALDGVGALAEAQGDSERAATLHEEALALWRTLGDRLGCARSLENLGIIEQHDRGNPERARELHEEALSLYQASGDDRGIASALANLGDVALVQGEHDRAFALFAESLDRSRRLGDDQGICIGLTNLGAVAFFRGDYARAAALYEESLPLWRALGDTPGLALALGNLGEAVQHQGDLDRATVLYEEALALCRQLGDKQGLAFVLSHVAHLARQRCETLRAIALYAESIELCRQVGELPRLAECLEDLAGAIGDQGDMARAARWLGVAAALRNATSASIPAVHRAAHDAEVDRVRAALGDAAFIAAWDAGLQLSVDDVAAEVAAVAVAGTPLAARSPAVDPFDRSARAIA